LICQGFQGGTLLAPQLAGAYAQLIRDHLLAQLLHVTTKKRVVNPPGARVRRDIGLGLKGPDGLGQDASQGRSRIEPICHAKRGSQEISTQVIGIVEMN
jgi:hypothetical protein